MVKWYCVDVPEAMALRERFLPAGERCVHLGQSALDLDWMDAIDASRGVFVTAQGLFMYFREDDVRRLFVAITERFPGVQILFDAVPHWFSKKTLEGFGKTRPYTMPPMPWGARRDELGPLLQSWSPRVTDVIGGRGRRERLWMIAKFFKTASYIRMPGGGAPLRRSRRERA